MRQHRLDKRTISAYLATLKTEITIKGLPQIFLTRKSNKLVNEVMKSPHLVN